MIARCLSCSQVGPVDPGRWRPAAGMGADPATWAMVRGYSFFVDVDDSNEANLDDAETSCARCFSHDVVELDYMKPGAPAEVTKIDDDADENR